MNRENLTDDEIENLLQHEADYFSMFSTCEIRDDLWLLECPQLPSYGDANRALHIRDVGAGADQTAKQALSLFTEKGLKPVVDLDPLAEKQGFRQAFLEIGLMETQHDRVLMRMENDFATSGAFSECIEVVRIDSCDIGREEARALWVETAIADDLGTEWEALWRQVSMREAEFTNTVLYLAFFNGKPAGCCSLFSKSGLGRVESVIARKGFRRRGVASSLVQTAVQDSLELGNSSTYLVTECGSPAENLYFKLGFEEWRVNFLTRLST